MSTRYWLGTTSADPTDVDNWSDTSGGATPASSVPGTTDTAIFDGAGLGDEPCTMTAHWTLGNLTTEVGYTAKFDVATFDLTIDDGGDITLAQAGEFDMGIGTTISITNGTFDYSAVGTLAAGASTLTFSGTCTITPANDALKHLTILDGTATVTDSSPTFTVNIGVLTISANATLSIGNDSQISHNDGTLVMGNDSTLTGLGKYVSYALGAGDGFTSRGTGVTIDVAEYHLRPIAASPVLAPGDYNTAFKLYNSSAAAGLLTLSAGAYTFDSLELESSNDAGTVTLDTQDATSITVAGELLIDLNNAANITIDNSIGAASCDWILQGDVTQAVTGGGSFVWTVGGGSLLFSGDADQNIDFGDQTPEDFSTTKDAGEISFDGGTFVAGDHCTAYAFTVSGDADMDMATYNLTCATTGDLVLDTTGTFDMGVGTISIENGTFDYSGVGTLIRGASLVTFTGTCTWTPAIGAAKGVFDVTILSGTTTVPTGANGAYIFGAAIISDDSTLLIDTGSALYHSGIGSGTLTTGSAARLGGAGTFLMYSLGAGQGFVSRGAGTIIDIAALEFQASAITPILQPGDYNTAFKLFNHTAGSGLLTLSAGAYSFDSLELDSYNDAGTVVLDTQDATSITVVGELLFDINKDADVTVNNSIGAASCDWILQGDVTLADEPDPDTGVLVWTKGGGSITLSGAADQSIDFDGEAIEDVIVDKTGGTVTLDAGFTTDSFTGADGTFDPNGQTIRVVGDMDWAAEFDFDPAADTMNDSDWIIGGDFTADGQTLNAGGIWTISVAGISILSGAGSIEYSDASGSDLEIVAQGWTDGGDNVNWVFELLGDWVLVADAVQEVLAADEYRDSILIQLHSQAAAGIYPVYLAFGADAVDGEGMSLLGVGDSVVIKGAKARGTISAVSSAGASCGIEIGGSVEYRHTRGYPLPGPL